MAGDKHILVNNDHLERSPVYSETQPNTSESRHQSPKFFGCCKAHIGWTIWYSIKSFFIILNLIYWNDIWPLVMEQGRKQKFGIVESIEWVLWLGNYWFLACFGLLMYGVHGKTQNRHGFFFPMIVNEWMQAIFVCLLVIILLFSSDAKTAGYFFIPTAIMTYVYIMFPIYLNRFRVHVKEATNYYSPVWI